MFRYFKYGKIANVNLNKDEYREFKSFSEADNWAECHYSKWIEEAKMVSVGGLNPFRAYGGNTFKSINGYHTYFKSEKVDKISIELSKAPCIPENIILYRAVEEEFIEELSYCNKNGIPLCRRAFTSTTLLKGVLIENDKSIETENIKNRYEVYQDYNYTLKIFAPIGSKGAYLDPIKHRLVKREAEILLPLNSKFRLIKYPYKDSNNKMIFECLLVN